MWRQDEGPWVTVWGDSFSFLLYPRLHEGGGELLNSVRSAA